VRDFEEPEIVGYWSYEPDNSQTQPAPPGNYMLVSIMEYSISELKNKPTNQTIPDQS